VFGSTLRRPLFPFATVFSLSSQLNGEKMDDKLVTPDQISALTQFSVGTLEGRDAMMVLEYAETADDLFAGVRRRLLLAMTPNQARQLAEGLTMAATSLEMGEPASQVRS
jgi:hypothetical protein